MNDEIGMPSPMALASLTDAPPQHVRPGAGRRASEPASGAAPGLSRARSLLLLAVVLAASGTAIVGAMRHTSTTFDEIVLIAGGARGYETGAFDLAPEHPPLMQYVYGLVPFLSGASIPVHAMPVNAGPGYRYAYAREFFWGSGNDPERLAFLGRIMAAACALALALLTYAFAAARIGRGVGLLAALLVAFLPDVLAHGGVAYNDVPLGLGFLAALWAADAAARRPTWRTGALAGAMLALALGVKFSAIALLPAAAVLLIAEAVARRGDAAWARNAALAGLAGVAAAYVALVVIYRGDFMLTEFRYGLDFTFMHVGQGHGAPGYLLTRTSPTGWWYFFPVAFLFKTPAALHILMVIALYAALRAGTAVRPTWRQLLESPLRPIIAGALVFGAALLASSLVIGFRYALPLLPLLCILVAAGVMRVWTESGRRLRAAIAIVVVLYAGSALSYYPYFLSYISEYGPGRDRGHLVLLDSSLDWGQGLLALRDFMRDEGVDVVYLSYFGSADPAGYGIDYVQLPSFFALESGLTAEDARPRWAAISATNLHGLYLPGDPLAGFRQIQPDRVLANNMLLYRIDE